MELNLDKLLYVHQLVIEFQAQLRWELVQIHANVPSLVEELHCYHNKISAIMCCSGTWNSLKERDSVVNMHTKYIVFCKASNPSTL